MATSSVTRKIKTLLIANRGEIACRIIETAKKMGIKTVAIYSEADTNSLHVRQADEAIYVGPSPSTLSYLNQRSILNAIKLSGADAVHPGFGFLSENAIFADLLEKNRITFVGPSVSAIKMMGDKVEAKKIAKKAGVNVIPGYIGIIESDKEALKIADKIGYPIMLKAVAGGGGKGIRIVRDQENMKQALSSTKSEARNNFADERMFIEKYIENPRHIEIQVLADKHGNYICLGERECSIQRHHQKVIEEAPSTFINDKIRKKMYAQSIALAKEVNYWSAGTVEFIVDEDHNFYFLEMNTRLQVEHPVTELITGIDIVEQMIRIAEGEKLTIKQKDVHLNGWAIEARIYAEDPLSGFLPSIGRVNTYQKPPMSKNIRIDTHMYEGAEVSMFYDAMISKLCVHAETRDECIRLMNNALGTYIIEGISHNMSFLQTIFNSPKFISGDISTHFIDNEYKGGFTGAVLSDEESTVILNIASYVLMSNLRRNTSITNQVRGNQKKGLGTRWIITLNNKRYPITMRPIDDGYRITFENRRFYITSKWAIGSKLFQCIINGQEYSAQVEMHGVYLKVFFQGSETIARIFTPRAGELMKFMKKTSSQEEEQSSLIANIGGIIRDIKVIKGDTLTKGQPLVALEAMKMENILVSPVDGVVKDVPVKVGDVVSGGDMLVEIEAVTQGAK